jgi:hypothetical protein
MSALKRCLFSVTNRYKHLYLVAIRPAWTWGVLGFFGILHFASFFRDEFLPEKDREHYKILKLLPDWSNTTGVAVLFFILVAILLEGSYRVANEQRKKINTLNARIRKLTAEDLVTLLLFDKAGAPLPGSHNIAASAKPKPNVLEVEFEKPVDNTAHIITMSGTPHVKKFDIDPTGQGVTIIFGSKLGDTGGIKVEE